MENVEELSEITMEDNRVRDAGDAGRCKKQTSKRKYSCKRKYHGKIKGDTAPAKKSHVAVSLKKVKKVKLVRKKIFKVTDYLICF